MKTQQDFYDWLVKQAKRNDPIGDLAGDVRGDSSFPRGITSLVRLRQYLKSKGATKPAIDALDEAHREWAAQQ